MNAYESLLARVRKQLAERIARVSPRLSAAQQEQLLGELMADMQKGFEEPVAGRRKIREKQKPAAKVVEIKDRIRRDFAGKLPEAVNGTSENKS